MSENKLEKLFSPRAAVSETDKKRKDISRLIARYLILPLFLLLVWDIHGLWRMLSITDRRFWCLTSSSYYIQETIDIVSLVAILFISCLSIGLGKSWKFFIASIIILILSLDIAETRVIPELFGNYQC